FGDPQKGARDFAIPKPNGPNAFEVMGIPLKHRGMYVVELQSRRLGNALLDQDAPMYVPTVALVTNLAVHFKKGARNSLIWVTALENAKPVAGADLAIADCSGNTLWRGTTDPRGLAMVPSIAAIAKPQRCDQQPDPNPDIDAYSDQTRPI